MSTVSSNIADARSALSTGSRRAHSTRGLNARPGSRTGSVLEQRQAADERARARSPVGTGDAASLYSAPGSAVGSAVGAHAPTSAVGGGRTSSAIGSARGPRSAVGSSPGSVVGGEEEADDADSAVGVVGAATTAEGARPASEIPLGPVVNSRGPRSAAGRLENSGHTPWSVLGVGKKKVQRSEVGGPTSFGAAGGRLGADKSSLSRFVEDPKAEQAAMAAEKDSEAHPVHEKTAELNGYGSNGNGAVYDKNGKIEHEEEYIQDSTLQGSARLQNPLAGIPKGQLLSDVDAFCDEWGMQEDREVFHKGALLAQKPQDFDTIPELDDKDRESLAYERIHKWKLPWMLYYSVILCAIGAATQGWDQTGANGANLSFPAEFGIGASVTQPGGPADEFKVGFVNSAPFISAALVGVWLSDPLNNLFGRRGEIFITSLVLIATPIGSGFTHSWQALAAVRLVLGLGLGAKAATVPMYAAELSPAHIRGALVMGWQLWTAFGIFLGFCANAVVKDTGRIAWRLQIGSAFIPAVPLALGIWFCPESPRWLMKKGKVPKAYRAMKKIRSTEVQAARDLYYAYVQYKAEMHIMKGSNYFSRIKELFTIPRTRRATGAGLVVHIAQQMCGINVISFYSSTIYANSGFTASQALYASIGFGALNFTFAFVALFTIDTFGRRRLLLWSFPNMAWSLLVAGFCFWIDSDNPTSKTRLALVALFTYIFTIFYSVGEGPVPFMYSAEIFPLAQREQGNALCVGWNNFWASVLSLTFPRMLRAFKPQGAFGFYCGLNLLAYCFIFLWVPETKQFTLEELDQVFSVSSRKFMSYQVTEMAPYKFRRWILRRRQEKIQPLFEISRDLNVGKV